MPETARAYERRDILPVRHRGGFDGDVRESAAMAWRAFALLQEELENDLGLTLPRNARAGVRRW